MERAEVLARRLKELRTDVGLDALDLPLLPDDPLCAAFWIWKGDPPEKRRELLIGRLRYRIEQLEDEEEREALLVAFRLHPDPDYHKDGQKLKDRRETLEKKMGYTYRTLQRREDTAIERIANGLVADLADPLPFFGRRITNVYLIFGRPMAKWRARIIVAVFSLLALGVFLMFLVWLGWKTHTFLIIKYPQR